jgi:hypothetical protein
MYTDLFRKIPVSHLQNSAGNFLKYASDVAYMTTAIELVGTRLMFLKELTYEYRYDTGFNDPFAEQTKL